MCRACKAKDQTITVLADQVDYLRSLLGQTPSTGNVSQPTNVVPLEVANTFVEPSDSLEDEDVADIRWAQANKLLTASEAEAAIERLKFDKAANE